MCEVIFTDQTVASPYDAVWNLKSKMYSFLSEELPVKKNHLLLT